MTYQPTDRPGPREVLLPTSAPISERLLMQCPKLFLIIHLYIYAVFFLIRIRNVFLPSQLGLKEFEDQARNIRHPIQHLILQRLSQYSMNPYDCTSCTSLNTTCTAFNPINIYPVQHLTLFINTCTAFNPMKKVNPVYNLTLYSIKPYSDEVRWCDSAEGLVRLHRPLPRHLHMGHRHTVPQGRDRCIDT